MFVTALKIHHYHSNTLLSATKEKWKEDVYFCYLPISLVSEDCALILNIQVIAIGYAIATTRSTDLDWKMRTFRILPMFLLPALSSLTYSAFVNFTRMRECLKLYKPLLQEDYVQFYIHVTIPHLFAFVRRHFDLLIKTCVVGFQFVYWVSLSLIVYCLWVYLLLIMAFGARKPY